MMMRGRQHVRNARVQDLGLELVIDRREMLEILSESKEHGTAVGICAPVLGQGMHVTAVDDILFDDAITIVLKGYDATGYMLEANKIRLEEIDGVCPFQSPLENPWLRSLK